MTVRRICSQLLLRCEDVAPSRRDFEVIGVFNPGAVRMAAEVVLLVRIAERPLERRTGFTGLPGWDANGDLVVDWIPDQQLEWIDARVVKRKDNGLGRLPF